LSRHFRRLVKSIRTLGLWNGGLVYYLYVRHRILRGEKWSCRQVRLKNVTQPVWMRPGVSDWIVMERIFLDREYDPISQRHDAAMDQLQSLLVAQGKRPLIIDCGANIGMSSVWLTERFPDATIISLEPEAANFEILSRTAKNFPNIIPMNVAISDRMSCVTLTNDGDTPWAWKTEETEEGGVTAVTIPYLVGLDHHYALMAVKVDIEGFEVNLFRDGAEWVDGLPLLVFEMHDWMLPDSGSGHSFFSALSRHRRDYLVRGENVFSYSHDVLTA
jgi:FkbM family methyltransferase